LNQKLNQDTHQIEFRTPDVEGKQFMGAHREALGNLRTPSKQAEIPDEG
jgi:hypothetical protein